MFLFILAHTLAIANRLYARYSFIVNYTLYAFLWIFLRGIPPNQDATVDRKKGWAPGVFVSCSEGLVGREVALRLATEGYTVHAGVESREEGEKIVRRWKNQGSSSGGSIRPVVCGVSNPSSVGGVVNKIRRYDEKNPNRRLVAIVCNTGSLTVASFQTLDDGQIDKTISSNLRSNISLIQSFLPLLTTSLPATKPLQTRIIILSSFISYTPLPGLAIPSATASALDSLARALMVECQGRNVRTTIVRTGFIRGSVPRVAGDAKEGQTVKTWRRITWWADRVGTPVEYVAKQVTDALTDRWMQPCYTLGCDALLAQALRDFVPEPIYEWMLVKVFGAAGAR